MTPNIVTVKKIEAIFDIPRVICVDRLQHEILSTNLGISQNHYKRSVHFMDHELTTFFHITFTPEIRSFLPYKRVITGSMEEISAEKTRFILQTSVSLSYVMCGLCSTSGFYMIAVLGLILGIVQVDIVAIGFSSFLLVLFSSGLYRQQRDNNRKTANLLKAIASGTPDFSEGDVYDGSY